ncbi:MAG: FUSC family protein [Oxalobacter sp.]|nr:FUSC family protein [Oxalobacter sp.]
MQHFLKWPTKDELLFAFRCVCAAALALYVALATGQPRPFWAPMATTILSLPVAAGSIAVRSLSRFLGTLLGVVAASVFIISFINYTWILCILTGAWIGICLYFSMLKRTTSAYTFTVAGWTVPVIMASIIADMKFINIQYIMDTAWSRGIETGIGFLSAILCHSLIFPSKIGPRVVSQLDGVWESIQQWTCGILKGQASHDPKKSVSAVTLLGSLRILTANLPFDVTNERWAINGIRMLQDRLTTMIPVVSSIEENLTSLRKSGQMPEHVETFLQSLSGWIARRDYSVVSADRMRQAARQIAPEIDGDSSWVDTQIVRLVIDIEKLISACEGCATRRNAINDAIRGRWDRMPKKMPLPLSVLHNDKTLSAYLAVAGGVSITLIMLIWVASGWSTGFVAPTMASIFFISFVILDNSVGALKTILKFTIIGLPAAYFYVLVVMFSAHSYEMLMMCFAPVIFISSIFIARRPISLGCTIFMMGIWSTTTMYDLDMANMTSFINGQGFAQCGGITLCLLCAVVFRSFDYAWTTGRMIRNIRKDIVSLTKDKRAPSVLQTIVKMVDRVNLLAPRLSDRDNREGMTLDTLIRQMRLGINMARIRSMQSRLERNGISIRLFLEGASDYIETQDKGKGQGLLADIDRLMHQLCMMESTVRKQAAVAALTSIRSDLFPDASLYHPQTLRPMEIV